MPYSGDPAKSDIDLLRFTVGDTDSTNELLTDTEYDYLIDSNGVAGDPVSIAPLVAESISAKLSPFVDYRIHGVSVSGGDLVKQYQRLSERLRGGLLGGTGADLPFAGGISVADKEAREANADNVGSQFSIGMHDLP